MRAQDVPEDDDFRWFLGMFGGADCVAPECFTDEYFLIVRAAD